MVSDFFFFLHRGQFKNSKDVYEQHLLNFLQNEESFGEAHGGGILIRKVKEETGTSLGFCSCVSRNIVRGGVSSWG